MILIFIIINLIHSLKNKKEFIIQEEFFNINCTHLTLGLFIIDSKLEATFLNETLKKFEFLKQNLEKEEENLKRNIFYLSIINFNLKMSLNYLIKLNGFKVKFEVFNSHLLNPIIMEERKDLINLFIYLYEHEFKILIKFLNFPEHLLAKKIKILFQDLKLIYLRYKNEILLLNQCLN